MIALAVARRVLVRRPRLVAPLAVLTLPFRIPINTGGNTSANLLVPLYFVVAAASLAWIVTTLREGGGTVGSSHRAGARPAVAGAGGSARGLWSSGPLWVARLLGAWLVLYALQALYSSDFDKALQQMVFFYVPFALLFALLRELTWDRALLHALPADHGRARADLLRDRVRRVRDEDDLPQLEAGRSEQQPHLLHGQFGLL